MFASNPLVSSSNPSSLQLPTISKTTRRRFRHSPSLSYTSMASTTASANASENVSALKAKYIDYARWLKASSRQNREPLFTHELLKHSLCEMGIDSTQAEQLVSTCTWYVYQFQKELEVDHEQRDQSITSETKTSQKPSKRRHRKARSTKSTKTIPPREHSSESTTTVTSINKENVSSGPALTARNKFPILPAIQTSESAASPRSRRVDFNNEQLNSESTGKQKSSHWRSAVLKTRTLPKLRSSEVESSFDNHYDIIPENTPIDFDLHSSQKNIHRNGLGGAHTRSILRKQISSCSSIVSTDVDYRKSRSRILTPASSVIDEIPLGTRSQRLFGGSECFAQIMNELEQQQLD